VTDPETAGLRSAHWFDAPGKTGFGHRSWLRNQGLPGDTLHGRPVIGICNTWSELNPCNGHLRAIAEHVKRGVWEAGGVPFEFPTISLGEPLMRPTAMVYRNLMSMDVEESIRANPIDAVVLLGGCDKTTPALLMGAASVDLPTIMLTGGPMLNGKYRGRDVGSGTDVWRFSEAVRAGTMTQEEFTSAEACMARSAGHCMTMGTASTMACLAEAMGIAPPGSAAIPAVDARRYETARLVGRRIVNMVGTDLTPSRLLTRDAFENAVVVLAALAGSTNAVIHLFGAGRQGWRRSDARGHRLPRSQRAGPPRCAGPAPTSWRISSTSEACPRSWSSCASGSISMRSRSRAAPSVPRSKEHRFTTTL
jgi:dihydroxyacid dehydratase/phosphogluconate dehydratase